MQNRRPNWKMDQYKNGTNTKTVQAKYKISNQIEKWLNIKWTNIKMAQANWKMTC